MPRFFFNLHDGQDRPDKVGVEFADWRAAQRHAVRLAGRIIDSEADRIELGENWHLEVKDDGGLSLFRLDFYMTLSPSLLHSKARAGKLV